MANFGWYHKPGLFLNGAVYENNIIDDSYPNDGNKLRYWVEQGTATAFILSGELPPGLTFSKSKTENNCYEIKGTVGKEGSKSRYDFTVRLKASDGETSDLGLYIEVTDITPSWTENMDPSDLSKTSPKGFYNTYQVINYTFHASNPGGPINYEKIKGELPEGVKLMTSGESSLIKNDRLYGFLPLLDDDKTFTFTIRANFEETSPIKYIDRTFTLFIQKAIKMSNPEFVYTGYLGDVEYGESVTGMNVQAYIIPTEEIEYELADGSELPLGLFLDSGGRIYGTTSTTQFKIGHKFSVKATAQTTRTYTIGQFSLNTNARNSADISIDSNFDLGEFKIGDDVYINKSFTSEYMPVNIWLKDGEVLPDGVKYKTENIYNTRGDIIESKLWLYGNILPQPQGNYSFTFQYQNRNVIYDITYSMDIIQGDISSNDLKFYISLPKSEQEIWKNQLQVIEDISDGLIKKEVNGVTKYEYYPTQPNYNKNDIFYHPYDPNFGYKENPKIYLLHNSSNVIAPMVNSTLKYNYPLKIKIGEIESVGIPDNEGTIIYYAIYRKIYDLTDPRTYQKAVDEATVGRNVIIGDNEKTIITPIEVSFEKKNIPYTTATINDLRDKLLGVSNTTSHYLPQWMNTPLTPGDDSTKLGWFPCLEIAFVTPEHYPSFITLLKEQDISNPESITGKTFVINYISSEPFFCASGSESQAYVVRFASYESWYEEE